MSPYHRSVHAMMTGIPGKEADSHAVSSVYAVCMQS